MRLFALEEGESMVGRVQGMVMKLFTVEGANSEVPRYCRRDKDISEQSKE